MSVLNNINKFEIYYPKSSGSWLLGNLCDTLTTIYGLSLGHQEMNLVYNVFGLTIAQLFVVKWVVVLILLLLAQTGWRNNFFAKSMSLASYIVWFVVVWNLLMIFVVGI